MSTSDIIAPQSAAVQPEQFQAALIENVSHELLSDAPAPVVVRAPTGAGKTFIISKVLEAITAESPTFWFWFVPFVNLVQQTEDAIAGNTTGLTPVSLLRGRNQEPKGGLVVITTAQSVARAKSRKEGYSDGEDDTTRSIDAQIARARANGLKVGLVVDEAHIGLDSQTEFGQFAAWLKPDRLIMASATPNDERLSDFIVKAGYSGFKTFAASRDDVVLARLNKRYIEAVVYSLRESMQTVTDLQQTVIRQAWKRNQVLKKRLDALAIPVVPLLLVQVANGPNTVAEAKKQLMDLCGVSPIAIGEHSSDEPDPVLMASIANDSTKEVLIFKQSAGTGFDAPRAFVLASTKPVNDPDFAAQFIGRVMRVHRLIRSKFPKPTPIDTELNTAYVYLANAEAQQGFQQAVDSTAGLKSQLQGQSEKLVAKKMVSGAVVYTNKEEGSSQLFYDAKLPGTSELVKPAPIALPTSTIGSTSQLDGFTDPELDQVDLDHSDSTVSFGSFSSASTADTKALLKKPLSKPKNRKDFLAALPSAGLKAYPLRSGLENLPRSLKTEQRPEMSDMAAAAKKAATRLDFSPQTKKLAVATAIGRVKEKEVRTELTSGDTKQQDVFVVVARSVLAKEAMKHLLALPQVEEEDAYIIIDVLSRRLQPEVEALSNEPDTESVTPAEIKRMSRDAAFAVIRKEYEALAELLNEEIALQAKQLDAAPLPGAMLFAFDIGLQPSSKNIYGVLPPTKDDMDKLTSVLAVDARSNLREQVVPLDDGDLLMAPFDGSHAMGTEETAFVKALDRAHFVRWWHRNPDRKGYSVRLVRGEHKNYFYPDFIVCLEHFPGDDPIQRLVETKESIKDAVRKSKRPSPVFGRVLFMTKDYSKWKWINADGSLGDEIDLDDLTSLQDWLRASVPSALNSSTHC
jgi:type III restriction enzyme